MKLGNDKYALYRVLVSYWNDVEHIYFIKAINEEAAENKVRNELKGELTRIATIQTSFVKEI